MLEPYFRFRLAARLPAAPGPRRAAGWARVREVEARAGRPFGDTVHDLRLRHAPGDIPDLLGISRHFLYSHFGWAMDRVAWVERTYGARLDEVATRRRAEGAAVASLAREWGLSPSALYAALRRARAEGDAGREDGPACSRPGGGSGGR